MASIDQILQRLEHGQTFTFQGKRYQKWGENFRALSSRTEIRPDEPRSESQSREDFQSRDTKTHSDQHPSAPGEPGFFDHRDEILRGRRNRVNPFESRNLPTIASEDLHHRSDQGRILGQSAPRHASRVVGNNQPSEENKEVEALSSQVKGLHLGTKDRESQTTAPAPRKDRIRSAQEQPTSGRQRHESIVSGERSITQTRDKLSDSKQEDVDDGKGDEDTRKDRFEHLTGVAQEFACMPFLDIDERAEFVVQNNEKLREFNLAIFLQEAVWQKRRGRTNMAQLCTQSLVLLRFWKDKRAREIFKMADRLTEKDSPDGIAYRKLYSEVEKVVNKGVTDQNNREGISIASMPPTAEKGTRPRAVSSTIKLAETDPFSSQPFTSHSGHQSQDLEYFEHLQHAPDVSYSGFGSGSVDPRLRETQPHLQDRSSHLKYLPDTTYADAPDDDPKIRTSAGDGLQKPRQPTSRHDSNPGRSKPQKAAPGPRNSNPDYTDRVTRESGNVEHPDPEEVMINISNVGTKQNPMQIIEPEDFAGEDAPKMQALSSLYKVPSNGSKFFEPGRVFAVLWSQPAGQPYPPKPQKAVDALEEPVPADKLPYNVTYGPHGQKIFSQIRRMVVIRNRDGYCWCVNIGTYGGRGLKKSGLKQSEIDAHAIIHDSTKEAKYLKGEPKTPKRPVAVDMANKQTLDVASRLLLAKPFSVEWNTRVMNVGMVSKRCMAALVYDAVQELFGNVPSQPE